MKTIISSLNNQQVKNINHLLKKKKVRDEQGVFVVEGLKMFEEARTEGLLLKAYFSESFYHKKLEESPGYFSDLNEGKLSTAQTYLGQVEAAYDEKASSATHHLEYEILADTVFQGISETITPQGVMGLVRMPRYSLEDMINREKTSLLLLEDIRDPGNLGTMVRTAEGAGITGIVMNSSCVDLFNPKVIRSTMGSIYRMPFFVTDDFILMVKGLKEAGVRVFAAHLSGQNYDSEDCFLESCAILIGNEANGLSEEVSCMADTLIKIPMAGKVESLNAAVAASILMYEVSRQRRDE